MRRISEINPASRSYMRGGNRAVSTGGAAGGNVGDIAVDPEVRNFIWGISILLMVFLGLLGGLMTFLYGLLMVPLTGGVALTLSKMTGRPPWAWSVASIYCVLCFFILYLVAS